MTWQCVVARVWPASNIADSAINAAPPANQAINAGRRRWKLLGVVLLMAAIVVALMLWGNP